MQRERGKIRVLEAVDRPLGGETGGGVKGLSGAKVAKIRAGDRGREEETPTEGESSTERKVSFQCPRSVRKRENSREIKRGERRCQWGGQTTSGANQDHSGVQSNTRVMTNTKNDSTISNYPKAGRAKNGSKSKGKESEEIMEEESGVGQKGDPFESLSVSRRDIGFAGKKS